MEFWFIQINTDNPSVFGVCMEIVCLVVSLFNPTVFARMLHYNIEFISVFVVYIFRHFLFESVLSLPSDLESFTPNLSSPFSISTAFLVPSMFFQSMEILSNNLSHSIFSRDF